MTKIDEIEIDLMPDGTVQFTRNDPALNEKLLEIISEISPGKKESVKEFLNGSSSIELLLGDEPLCG